MSGMAGMIVVMVMVAFAFMFQLADVDMDLVMFAGGLHIGSFLFMAYEVVGMRREGMRLNTYQI
jgi:uncharacterized membrane protein YhhN